MKQIVITRPDAELSVEREAECIRLLLRSGAADIVHLRKPQDALRVIELLEALEPELYPRLSVHRFPEIAARYGTRYHAADGESLPEGLKVSASCHTLAGARTVASEVDYLFLSPIFESISKQGYTSSFTAAELIEGLPAGKVIGLGGVTPRRVLSLKRCGFIGAAYLGYAWRHADSPEKFLLTIEQLRLARNLAEGFSLQFITSAPTAELTAAQAIEAMRGGCRWVQVRMKDADPAQVIHALQLLEAPAGEYGAVLMVDDHVQIAAELPFVAGVHLGHNDMPRAAARALLGENKIIGSTANTAEQATALAPLSDYLGVGPFRFTTTKQRLAPILGAEGIAGVVDALKGADSLLPIVAIGGIEPADIPEVLATGACGIAISGAIHKAENPTARTQEILNEIENTKIHP